MWKVSKTDSCFSKHRVFSLSLWAPPLTSPYPFIIPLVGFSKYVCEQLEMQLEPEPLVKSYWVVIGWLSCSPFLLCELSFWVSLHFCLTCSMWGRNLSSILLEQQQQQHLIQVCPVLSFGVYFLPVSHKSISESSPTRLDCCYLPFCIHLILSST